MSSATELTGTKKGTAPGGSPAIPGIMGGIAMPGCGMWAGGKAPKGAGGATPVKPPRFCEVGAVQVVNRISG